MDTRDDTISEVAATSAPRGGSDWGHLPQSDLTNLIIRAGFEVHNVQWRRIPRSGVCQRPDGRASAARRSGRSKCCVRGRLSRCLFGPLCRRLRRGPEGDRRNQGGQGHRPGSSRAGLELPARVRSRSGPRLELRQLGPVQARRRVAAAGPGCNQGRIETTTARQRKTSHG